jgi:hypothetical protein
MQFLPLGYHTFLDSTIDYERVTLDHDTTERMHRRALRQSRRRRC